VYRCEQPLLGREAVIKVLHQRLRGDDVALRRFMREALLASRLDHPYAAHVYAFGIEPDGLFWIAMELVQGTPLDRWLRERGPLPLDQFVPFFDRVAEVVYAAHERGIVHRDLKPSNVMVIERAGRLLPKLLDFGVAKLIDDEVLAAPQLSAEHHEPSQDGELAASLDPEHTVSLRMRRAAQPRHVPNRLTGADTAIGSPPYMSPEQWSDPMTVGPASDLYALGVVAFEALTGRRPFTAPTCDDYTELHRTAPIPPLGGTFSSALDRVFQRALAKRPEDRFESVLEMAAALRTALRSQPREQLRIAAQQWQDRSRPRSLLWRAGELADLDRWSRSTSAVALGDHEASFVTASRGQARRGAWIRGLSGALAAMVVFGVFQYRAAVQTRTAQQQARMAEKLAASRVTVAHVEQGRQALLHGDTAEAAFELAQAYRRGEHSPGVSFMLARALQPRLAELARFTSTTGRMWSAAFSPDGHQVVTTDDRSAQIWDAANGHLLFTLAHDDTVYHAVYSADGTRLATASGDGAVRIWDSRSGALTRVLKRAEPGAPTTTYYFAALSPDGRFVAAIDLQGEIANVWDAGTGAQVAELRNDASEFPSLAFSSDGRWLATSGGNDVRVFETRSWARVLTIPGQRMHTLSFDPTGSRLATGSAGGDAAIWAIPSGARLRHLSEIGEPIDGVAFSPSGELVVTASRDGAERVWNAGSGALQSQGNHLRSKILSIEFDATSKLVLAAGSNGTVVVADAALGMPVAALEGSQGVVRVAHFDPSSRRVVGASADGIARVWDATSPYRRWGAPQTSDDCGLVTSLEPDRRFVAIGCRNEPTRVWDTARDELLAELPSVTQTANGFSSAFPAVSFAGDRAAIARGNTVVVYELPGGRALRTITHSAAVNTVAFAATGHDVVSGAIDGSLLVTRDSRESIALPMSPAGIDVAAILADGRVVAADARSRLRVYDPDRNAVLAELEVPARVRTLRPSSNGRRLVTVPGYLDKTAPVLLDLEHYRRVAQLDGRFGRVFAARFVGEGQEILTAGGDGIVRMWDGDTGRLHQTYRGSSRFLADAALTPDGSMVVAGGGDGLLRFWDATTGAPLWTIPAHKSHVVGVHFEGNDIVTRGFGGDLSRWSLPRSEAVIDACEASEACVIVSR